MYVFSKIVPVKGEGFVPLVCTNVVLPGNLYKSLKGMQIGP